MAEHGGDPFALVQRLKSIISMAFLPESDIMGRAVLGSFCDVLVVLKIMHGVLAVQLPPLLRKRGGGAEASRGVAYELSTDEFRAVPQPFSSAMNSATLNRSLCALHS